MRDMPPRESEELLLWVKVTLYHPHNSLNLPRDLLLGYLITWSGRGVGDSTTSVNSLSPQMSELVEDAVTS